MANLNFGEASHTHPVSDFRGIVLAGVGSKLRPLTNDLQHGSLTQSTPKAALLVGNQPMIIYPLVWLQDAGVRDVTIFCPNDHKEELKAIVHNPDPSWDRTSSLSVTVTGVDDASLGTADILRKHADLLKSSDNVIVPCDFIPHAELKLQQHLDAHRQDIDGTLVRTILCEQNPLPKDGPARSMYGYCEQTNLLLYAEVNDEHKGEEELELPTRLFQNFSQVTLTSKYQGSHVFIVRPSFFSILSARPSLSSLERDVIPWLCKFSYRPSYRRKWSSQLSRQRHSQHTAFAHSSSLDNFDERLGIHTRMSIAVEKAENSDQATRDRTTSALANLVPELKGAEIEDLSEGYAKVLDLDRTVALVPCVGVFFNDLKDGFATRANTIGSYVEINKQKMALHARSAPAQVKGEAKQATLHQVSGDSIVAESTRIGERTTIKKSIIGPHCVIGKNVKINGSIVMDHVEIKDGAKLENVILSRNVSVAEKAQLKDCELAPGVVVPVDSNLKNQRLSSL